MSGAKKAVRTLLLALGLLVAVIPAGPASAHTDVDEYTPTTGEILETTPETIVLRFSTAPNQELLEVRLSHRDGREVPFTGTGPEFDGRTVTLRPPALDLGTYVIVWESVGADGHIAAGQSYFSVGIEEAGGVGDFTPRNKAGSNILETITRFALYGLLSLLAGVLLLAATGLLRGFAAGVDATRVLGAGLLLTWFVRFFMVSGRAGGRDGIAGGASRILTSMPGSLGWMLFLLGAVTLTVKRHRVAGIAGLVLVAVGETLAGHMGTARNAVVLVPLTAAHLLGIAIWVGGVATMALLGVRGRGAFVAFARRFTPWALGSAFVVFASGVVLTVLRTKVGDDGVLSLLDYSYGRQLTLKWVALFLAVIPLGTYHLIVHLWPRLSRYLRDSAAERTATDGTGTEDTATEGRAEDDLANRVAVARPRRRGVVGTLAIEAVLLLGVLVTGSSLAGLSPVKPPVTVNTGSGDLLATPQSFEECMSPESATNQLLCVTRYFEGVVSTQGMNVALVEVGDRWKNGDRWMQTNCHSIGHKLGRLGFRMFKDIPTAFKQGSDPCDYGYLHGVIEGASADFSDEELVAAMTKMCEGTGDTSNHGYRQCIHGLGHAAARRVNNDLARGMEFCRVFGAGGDQNLVTTDSSIQEVLFRLCITGVSMEWNTQPKALDAAKLPIGAPGTLLGECSKLEEIFQPGCIEYGTSSLGGQLEREIDARNWCDANLKDPLPCYQSIGRDVIWSPTISREDAVKVCTGGKQGIYAEQCIIRALGSVATIALDADAIDEFCPVLPPSYQGLCATVKETMRIQIEQTVRGFITEPAPAGTAPGA
jgi:copper transport protein